MKKKNVLLKLFIQTPVWPGMCFTKLCSVLSLSCFSFWRSQLSVMKNTKKTNKNHHSKCETILATNKFKFGCDTLICNSICMSIIMTIMGRFHSTTSSYIKSLMFDHTLHPLASTLTVTCLGQQRKVMESGCASERLLQCISRLLQATRSM